MTESQEDTIHRMLLVSVILHLLIDRVSECMGERINQDDLENLYNVMFNKVY